MTANPFLGVFFHWLGGLAAASFYIPYRGVRRWAWETYWLVGGVFSWIIAPWLLAWLLVPGLGRLLAATDTRVLLLAYGFGALWGIGGLTFGLSMRYLGIALGYAIALGLCAAFGTLVPPIVGGEIGKIASETSGRMILLGVAVCLGGIAVSGAAGRRRERETPRDEHGGAASEFDFRKGLLVALFAGVMSACFAYGLAAGKPLADRARADLLSGGHSDLWQNLPVLVVVLWGGFTTNCLYCAYLNVRNRNCGQYLGRSNEGPMVEHSIVEPDPEPLSGSSGATAVLVRPVAVSAPPAVPLLANYLLSAVAGITWYFQFFFYSMGQARMGPYGFSSWTLHMASIIIFSTLWGIALHEWKGTSRRTHTLLAAGLLILIASTIIVGYGNFLKASPGS